MSTRNRKRLLHKALESRVLMETALYHLTKPLLLRAGKGDGHGVYVIPGFLAPDALTASLRKSLVRAGYRAEGWNNGPNVGMRQDLFDTAIANIRQLAEATGGPVSVVGWSLGGLYARAIANTEPGLVRQVVTLGGAINITPEMVGDPQQGAIRRLFNALNPADADGMDVVALTRDTPPVPFTAIYSKSDGIVDWRMSVDARPGARCQNIRIRASHLGLTHNALVLHLLLRILPMDDSNWQPIKLANTERHLMQMRHYPAAV